MSWILRHYWYRLRQTTAGRILARCWPLAIGWVHPHVPQTINGACRCIGLSSKLSNCIGLWILPQFGNNRLRQAVEQSFINIVVHFPLAIFMAHRHPLLCGSIVRLGLLMSALGCSLMHALLRLDQLVAVWISLP